MNMHEGEFFENMTEEEALMLRVQQADFVAIEWTLYTDTHQDDEVGLQRWQDALREAAKARKQYESRFGPLSLRSVPSDQALDAGWRWTDTPWPWQR